MIDPKLERKRQINREYYSRNKEKIQARVKKFLEDHPGYTAARFRKRFYNLSELEFNTLMLIQCGKCAICQEMFEEEGQFKPQVDHNHETNKNRSLLCQYCNSGLAFFREDTVFLNNAIEYLKEHNA